MNLDSSRAVWFRFAVPILLAFLLVPIGATVCANASPVTDDTFAQIAQALAGALEKVKVKRVVILDFTGVDGKPTPFGAWLADQLSAANSWAGVDVLDRKKLATDLNGLLSADTGEVSLSKVRDFSKSHDTEVITGSYSGADGGIGVTLSSIDYRKLKMPHGITIRAKIAWTDQLKSGLATTDSLVPGDGIYAEGEGGVGACECNNQQLSLPTLSIGPIKGTATFTMVINPDGHVSDISQCKATGTAINPIAVCKNLEKAPTFFRWGCKAAVNIDGKRVPTRRSIFVSFGCVDDSGSCYVVAESRADRSKLDGLLSGTPLDSDLR